MMKCIIMYSTFQSDYVATIVYYFLLLLIIFLSFDLKYI